MNRLAKGLGVLAALPPLLAVPTAEAATVSAVPPLPSPATVLALSPAVFPGGTNFQLQGVLCQAGRTCVGIDVPLLVPQGVPGLDSAIDSTSGPVIVAGFSEGAQVAEQWIKQHANDPDAPNPNTLTFVAIGNPTRAYGGSNFGELWPASQYQVIDVARQYDLSADFPNNPSSPYFLLAVFNAMAGVLVAHDYVGVNVYDPANTVWKVGNITYVLVPNQRLPLVDGLRSLGLNALADQMQAQLKPLVDQGYNRNYPGMIQPGVIAAAASTFAATTEMGSAAGVSQSTVPFTTASASSVAAVSDATVAAQDTLVPVSFSSSPPTDAESAAAFTPPESPKPRANGRAVADTTTTATASTASASESAGGLDTGKPTRAPAAQPGLSKAFAAKHSAVAPAPSIATPTTDRSNAVTGQAGRNTNATTHNANRASAADADGQQATSPADTDKRPRSKP